MSNRLLISVLFLLGIGCTSTDIKPEIPRIIPQPLEIELNKGAFTLNPQTTLKADETLGVNASYLKNLIREGTGIELEETETIAANQIVLEVAGTDTENEEAYELEIDKNSIKIKAAGNRGIFYGIQSLRQLFPPCFEDGSCEDEKFAIQALNIKDEPRFVYRGMHLDVGRHFFDIDDIKTYIDMLAMLKMNTFHWHLTEDQGWRIEIKKYPRLTEVGAYRKETLIGHYNDQPHKFDGKRYGGFYTQEQVKEIVAYAAERQITVVPEIEMPGHSQAAIAAYPELGCAKEPVEVATKWGIFEEIYCPNEKTFAFLEGVLDEVIALFPSEYIHIGGDEAPKTRWKSCAHCQQLIKKEGLKDEHELQSYFITRMEKYLNSKGRQIIGWDEILEGGLAPNATVMSWRGMQGGIEAAKHGNHVVMTPTSHSYFDYYQSENENEPLAIGGFLPLKKVYEFNPIPEELNAEEAKLVLGAQGNIWTEYMPDFDKVTYMAFPRAIALSEVVWSEDTDKDYLEFISRLERFQERMDHLNIKYANHLYEIEGELINEDGNLFYELKTLLPDKEIRYTVDGTDLNSSSPLYTSPIKIDRNITIKAGVYEDGELLGSQFVQKLNYHKAVNKKIELNVQPHEAYNAGGREALINSINGNSKRFGDSEWLGFWGDDLEILIDLEEEVPVKKISTRFFNANGQWVYAPGSVTFSLSADKENMNSVTVERDKNSGDLIIPMSASFAEEKVRYIKIEVENYGLIPDGKQGAGNRAWTFIDEIIVE
ncbi:family 20 glycosylhydrolase [Leptobacterium flavescens]|uniref:beta-N-acetylhexosaminidase n=1 Tax=Leptobacterium flavescens TaxID=472055 RepID=A0A6P0UHI3_9FLAO|nr:family 20 glycosylhydrolase [Leptobacterium flavescens]NER12704.1 family 20 glycosylhydrolase [Leptobacterium flavescens]